MILVKVFIWEKIVTKQSLKAIKYGNQYVAKTDFACSKIEILDCKELYGREISDLRDYSLQKRKQCKNIINEMTRKYRKNGLFIDEIIQEVNQQKLNSNLSDEERDDSYDRL